MPLTCGKVQYTVSYKLAIILNHCNRQGLVLNSSFIHLTFYSCKLLFSIMDSIKQNQNRGNGVNCQVESNFLHYIIEFRYWLAKHWNALDRGNRVLKLILWWKAVQILVAIIHSFYGCPCLLFLLIKKLLLRLYKILQARVNKVKRTPAPKCQDCFSRVLKPTFRLRKLLLLKTDDFTSIRFWS